MALSLTLLNATIDLVSFSGILFSIYPPLFAALIAYSVTGTGISILVGKVGWLWAILHTIHTMLARWCYGSPSHVSSIPPARM